MLNSIAQLRRSGFCIAKFTFKTFDLEGGVTMEEIRQKLLQMRSLLELEMDKHHAKERDEHDPGDEIDLSVEEQGRVMDALLEGKGWERLELIKNTLTRMEDGEFGICEECGEEIAKKRLLALPFARLCINCQQEYEKGHIAHGLPMSNNMNWAEND